VREEEAARIVDEAGLGGGEQCRALQKLRRLFGKRLAKYV
jgi:hypothetical protein